MLIEALQKSTLIANPNNFDHYLDRIYQKNNRRHYPADCITLLYSKHQKQTYLIKSLGNIYMKLGYKLEKKTSRTHKIPRHHIFPIHPQFATTSNSNSNPKVPKPDFHISPKHPSYTRHKVLSSPCLTQWFRTDQYQATQWDTNYAESLSTRTNAHWFTFSSYKYMQNHTQFN